MAILQRAFNQSRQVLQGLANPSASWHWTLHLTLALALAAASLGWRQAALGRELEHARAEAAGNRATGAALVVKERRKAVTAQAAGRAVAGLSTATLGHPTWADEPVPTEVQDALAP